MQDLFGLLRGNPYPGRGIVLGRSADGMQAVVVYFITGRSENSRNRVFTETDGGIITEAANPAKVEDPSLILYAPVRRHGTHTIVTNGDQTDTIYECLERGIGFSEALRTRTFEPDTPNYTPRISGLLAVDFDGFPYALSILKSAEGDPASVQRMTFEYPQPLAGRGHYLHTYRSDGNPLPSFEGEPRTVRIGHNFGTAAELDDFTKRVWDALDENNKISLFVRAIRLDGSDATRIINRYKKEG